MKNYQCEILAPAGRMEDIAPLIKAKADAVYVGLDGFSSRPQSADFTLEEIKEAVKKTHENQVKLFVAVNSNPPTEKMQQMYEAIRELDQCGVDAFIIADCGILKKLSKIVSNAALHVSTLMGVYNKETVRYLKQMGVSRIILSSDLYMDEIVDMIDAEPDLEYEIVADGGICFNSNRQCMLPHTGVMEDYRVYCQKDYELYRDGQYVQDAYRIGNCPGMIHRTMGIYLGAGVYSFKIEGRTNALDYILMRVASMYESKKYYLEHSGEIPGYMHYIRRSYR